MDIYNPDFSKIWSLSTAAEYLLGDEYELYKSVDLVRKMRESALIGRLEIAVQNESLSYGIISSQARMVRPIDVIAWAYENSVHVSPACAEWYARVTKKKPKSSQPGPRDETLYRLIAAMARALEYTPGQGEKSGQNKLKMITNHTALDKKTIRKHIVDALNKFPNDCE